MTFLFDFLLPDELLFLKYAVVRISGRLEEMTDGLKIVDERHSWKAIEEKAAVAACHHPHIKNGKHSTVRAVADEPPQPLL